MNVFATNLDKLKLREDLFREVKYFVTENSDAKIDKLLKDGGASCCNYLVLCGDGFDESEFLGHCFRKIGMLGVNETVRSHTSVSQVTATDRNRLFALITFNGGVVERNFTARTTHLICGSIEGPAYAKAITISDNFCVVTTDWIIDSLSGQELRDPQM